MATVAILVILLYLSIFNNVVAYYGEINGDKAYIPSLNGGRSVAIGDTIYIMGGYEVSAKEEIKNFNITTLNFASNGDLVADTFPSSPDQYGRQRSQAFSLGDNKTIVAVNVQYPHLNTTEGHPYFNITDSDGNVTGFRTAGLAFCDVPTNTWTNTQNNSLLPPFRRGSVSAMSPENDAIYTIGGIYIFNQIDMPQIYRFDLNNISSIVNMTAIDSNLSVNIIEGTAQMLPNGVIVIAFGYGSIQNRTLLDTSHVTLFDTRRNQIYTQPVSGVPPFPRYGPGSTLGPDKSTIYYYGGGNQRALDNPVQGDSVPGLVLLDTTTWTWIYPNVPGLPTVPNIYCTVTLFENTKLIIALGLVGSVFTNTIGVITNVPQSSNELQNSQMRWFTNNPEFDQRYLLAESQSRLSQGAIAGIAIAVLIIVVLIITLLWRCFPNVKRIGIYIQNEIIWNPRSGEPLWAETARLLVRFILLFLLLAFIVYSIHRSIESPIVTQQIRTPTDVVRSPDIRFCYDGFNDTDSALMQPNVFCAFRNGTDCSNRIIKLNMTDHTPMYPDRLGSVTCFMFISDSAHSFKDDKLTYSQITSTKMLFTFQGQPRLYPDETIVESGVIYIDMYPPGYNPNVDIYNLTAELGPSQLSNEEIREWVIAEQGYNTVGSMILKTGVTTTVSYEIIEKRALRRYDGWNYVGFSSNYDKSFYIESFLKDAAQNIALLQDSVVLAQLTLQPLAFTINIDNEQKIFSLLNAFAQVGGVLGLFIALQTVLFGFRPQSPWGIVHRWSFGKLRIKLTDRLANYFDIMGTPVPLVNPVSRRLNTVFRNHVASSTADYPYSDEEAYNQDNRVHQVEERLQLMELLLKSYYLNDEVFRSLDQAVKRGNEERRRGSSIGVVERSTTDPIMMTSEAVESDDKARADEESIATVGLFNRRGSGSVSPQQRGVYQPNLALDQSSLYKN